VERSTPWLGRPDPSARQTILAEPLPSVGQPPPMTGSGGPTRGRGAALCGPSTALTGRNNLDRAKRIRPSCRGRLPFSPGLRAWTALHRATEAPETFAGQTGPLLTTASAQRLQARDFAPGEACSKVCLGGGPESHPATTKRSASNACVGARPQDDRGGGLSVRARERLFLPARSLLERRGPPFRAVVRRRDVPVFEADKPCRVFTVS